MIPPNFHQTQQNVQQKMWSNDFALNESWRLWKGILSYSPFYGVQISFCAQISMTKNKPSWTYAAISRNVDETLDGAQVQNMVSFSCFTQNKIKMEGKTTWINSGVAKHLGGANPNSLPKF